MGKRWFAALKKGIGWKPVTWQGYLIIVIYLGIIIWDFIRVYQVTKDPLSIAISYLPEFLIFTVILSFICYFTGEKPKF